MIKRWQFILHESDIKEAVRDYVKKKTGYDLKDTPIVEFGKNIATKPTIVTHGFAE